MVEEHVLRTVEPEFQPEVAVVHVTDRRRKDAIVFRIEIESDLTSHGGVRRHGATIRAKSIAIPVQFFWISRVDSPSIVLPKRNATRTRTALRFDPRVRHGRNHLLLQERKIMTVGAVWISAPPRWRLAEPRRSPREDGLNREGHRLHRLGLRKHHRAPRVVPGTDPRENDQRRPCRAQSGRISFRKIVNSLAPSILAASISALGTCSRNCFIKKTP